jgi:predicted PurR-regulated permease PerM
MQTWLQELANNATRFPLFKELDVDKYISNLDVSAGSIIQQSLTGVTNGLGSVIGKITTIVLLLVTVPFILFYMLKDGEKLVPNIERLFPEKQRENIKGLLQQLNKTLSDYISGQAIECLFVGTFTFLGYWRGLCVLIWSNRRTDEFDSLFGTVFRIGPRIDLHIF